MNALRTSILLVCLIMPNVRAGDRKHNLEFRQVELTSVISQLARMEGKSAIFSGAIVSRPIDVSLKNVTADFALNLILENYGYTSVDKSGVYHVMTPVERGPVSNPTTILTLNHVLAKEIEGNLRTLVTANSSLTINEQQNTIVLSGPDDFVLRVKKVVELLDQEAQQVFIEAKIVETSTSFSRALGIEWGPNLSDRTAVTDVSLATPGKEDLFKAGVITQALGNTLQARLKTGERNGDVKIISSPKITTLNGVGANIDNITTFSIKTLASTGGGGASTGGLAQVKAGVSLKVTPFIVSNDQVRLNVSLSKSDPDFVNAIDGIPGISDNSATTSLIVQTGETASIGGLIYRTKHLNRSGIPILSTIPIIGVLFGNMDTKKDEKELMIFLTPHIFRGKFRPQERPNVVDIRVPQKTGPLGAQAPVPVVGGETSASALAPTASSPTAPNAAPALLLPSEDRTTGTNPATP